MREIKYRVWSKKKRHIITSTHLIHMDTFI